MKTLTQAKGLDHIRNLRNDALKLWEDYDYDNDLWEYCVFYVMTKFRILAENSKEKIDEKKEEIFIEE